MWPVKSASKGAVASGQQCYTEAHHLWHPLFVTKQRQFYKHCSDSGCFVAFSFFPPFFSLLACNVFLKLFSFFLLVTQFVFSLPLSVWFCDLSVQINHTSVTLETWATVFFWPASCTYYSWSDMYTAKVITAVHFALIHCSYNHNRGAAATRRTANLLQMLLLLMFGFFFSSLKCKLLSPAI